VNGLRDGGADAAPLVAQQREETDRGATQLGRDVEKGGDVKGCEDHRQPADDHAARPDDLPRADVEVHLRHPVISNTHDDQPRGHEPARIGPAREGQSHNEEQK
jgi:hypothetical protein